ncbi:S41 family peptidase [Lentibacillus kimchii]|uniref:S41 family peptidase n=1 Tax=Lentibacillus kimchii TaxID=1542911 RepID=A0ABW2UX03_9BACI
MRLRKLHMILILTGALVLGVAGGFLGVELGQSDDTPKQEDTADSTDADLSVENSPTSPDNMQKVTEAYNLIKDNYLEDVTNDQLIEGAIKGMVTSLDDPYSSYMDSESMEQFSQTIESSFEGIGAKVSMKNGKVTIVSPIKDSPAEDAGLRPNDQILSVDGESVSDSSLHEAVQKIRGEKGSEVSVEIQRSGVSEPFDVDVVRDDIPVETVHSNMQKVNGKKTGTLEISSFAQKTGDEFKKKLASLEDNNIEGLVIDVRGNPGGVLTAVEDVLGNFIPKDMPDYQIENRNGETEKFYSSLDEKKPYPISVLINEGSASASEILAVAMKEAGYDVVGTTSFGKGTVQRAVPVGDDGSRVKLTLNKWLSPEGKWIHEKGVEPTVKEEQPDYYFTNPVQVEDKMLAYDQTGDNIGNVQEMLSGLDYDPGRTDGYFSRETETAVENFQADHDLDATGKVDEQTAGSVESAIVDQIRDGKDDKQLAKALHVLYKQK